MKTTTMSAILVLALGLTVCWANVSNAASMGTAFTYQGRLMRKNRAAKGLYDLKFKLFDDPAAGSQLASTIDVNELEVIKGYFTTELDFGDDPNIFNGDARWLEIDVRPNDRKDPNDFVTLSPRQEITPTPYALYAMTAGHIPGGVTGRGTTNHISKFTGPNAVGDSVIYESTGSIGIGTTAPTEKLHVNGTVRATAFSGSGWNMKDLNANNVGGGTLSDKRLSANVSLLGQTIESTEIMDGTIRNEDLALGSFCKITGVGTLGSLTVNGGTNLAATSGNVGIGTTNPAGKLEVAGNAHVRNDFVVRGAYRGTIGPNNGAPFPRPAFDSGWRGYGVDRELVTIFHNIGGNVDNYIVDTQWKEGANILGDRTVPNYQNLTTSSIMVYSYTHRLVRVRIWVYN
jgi:hypothetical protein